jgi:hypothetical protein
MWPAGELTFHFAYNENTSRSTKSGLSSPELGSVCEVGCIATVGTHLCAFLESPQDAPVLLAAEQHLRCLRIMLLMWSEALNHWATCRDSVANVVDESSGQSSRLRDNCRL